MEDVLQPIPAQALRIGSGRTRRFVGREHGAGLSYFFVDNDPGQGPELHRHPYTETWIVLEGEAEVTIGDRVFRATEGDTVTAPRWTWHRFVNSGSSRLRIVCMHASPVIIQEWWDSRGTLDIPSLTE